MLLSAEVAFNRTKVELKFGPENNIGASFITFNRTKVELKYGQ